ncbi:MAG: peroxiredoxin-like family protein [Candidatus Thiodiazotropha taylori]
MKLKSGDKAPYFEVSDVHGNTQTTTGDGSSPVHLTFYRHAGCPPCNLRVHELMAAKDRFDQLGVKMVGVFESTAEHIRQDLAHGEVTFPILPDRERKLYEKFSVNPSLSGFISSFLLRPAYSMKAIFKHGYFPKFAEATTMMPAEFLIAPDGAVIMAHYGKDLGDYVPLDTLYQLMAEMQPTESAAHAVERVRAV